MRMERSGGYEDGDDDDDDDDYESTSTQWVALKTFFLMRIKKQTA